MRTSESIKNIAVALAKFQGEVNNPKHTADNPFFKSRYTPLHDIINHIRPALANHGLSVLQNPSGDGESVTITTLLMHESGEWIETDPLTMRAEKITPQGAGAVITYARRYSLSAVLGIASEDDDDGNSAEQSKPKQQQQQRPKQKQQAPLKPDLEPKQEGLISEARARRMFALAKGNADIVRQVLREYSIEGSKQVPNKLYDEICDKVQMLAIEQEVGQ